MKNYYYENNLTPILCLDFHWQFTDTEMFILSYDVANTPISHIYIGLIKQHNLVDMLFVTIEKGYCGLFILELSRFVF